MEKIQDAIAKARDVRKRTLDRSDPAIAPADQTGPQSGRRTSRDVAETSLDGIPEGTPQITGLHITGPHITGAQTAPRSGLPQHEQIADHWAALPAFAPKAAHLQRNRIVAFTSGREATAFDVIRTRLLQQMRANNWRRLAITSPGPGCGKSMLTLNLAFSLGRQQDQRTVVIDLDMRRPSMANYLGIKQEYSVAKVLDGTGVFADSTLRYGKNLAFTPHSGAIRNSAELLQSTRTAEVLDEITATYDPTIMIFDMPPMQAGDDVMAFVSRVDCVLLVAAAEETTIKQVDTCERDLATQTNVLGVILNKCRYMSEEESYGYYE